MCFIDCYVFLLSSGLLMGFIWSTWTISTASAGQWDTGLPVWVFFLRVLSMELNLISFRKHILTD